MHASKVHRIDDLAQPRLPLPLRALNALLRPFAPRLFPLAEDKLLSAAQTSTGLREFGDERFRIPLRELLRALEDEARLTPVGRFLTRRMILQLLVTRLRVQDLTTRHPEIKGTPVERPIVVLGLPRTGTTHLHNLLSRDPAFRFLQLGPLLATFPDACIVQTHRDPVAVTASLCTMTAYGLRMHTASIDPAALGSYWATRVEVLLQASVRDRPLVPPAQVFDLRFHEFMADQTAMVERLYAFAGAPLTPQARGAMRAFVRENPRGKRGRIEYRLEDFGLDRAERRRALRFDQERFAVPDE